MKHSADGGTTWNTLWNSATEGDPQYGISPALELDENENLYVIANYLAENHEPFLGLKMYKFTKASGYSATGVTPTTLVSTHASGKWGVFLDQGRQWIWVILWADNTNPNLYAFNYDGTTAYSRQIFKVFSKAWSQDASGNPVNGASDLHGEPAYPTVYVGTDGTVYVAWNGQVCEAGDFTNSALSYYDVRFVYSTSTKAEFLTNSETWLGPQSGVSGTPSTRTVPFAGDDSGTQAETAYPICKLSDQTEFIPASDPNYGFGTPGVTAKRYNFNRLFNIAFNKNAVHFYYESETSDARAIQHHSYARFNMVTHAISDSERRSPEFHYDVTNAGDRAGAIGGQGGGAFIQDTTQASRLYFVQATSRDLDETFRVLRSDDGGQSWWLYATSGAIPGAGSNGLLLVQAYRWVLPDGSLRIIFQYADSPFTVYTAKITPSNPPAQLGPWLAESSPWRTPIPQTDQTSATGLDWTNYVHADTASMVTGVSLQHDYTPAPGYDIHAWAYDEADMVAKGDTAIESHWLGPGGVENVIYGKSTDTFNTIYMDFPSYKASSISCPIPINWTGYDTQSQGERRTIITCDDGRAWVAYEITPPGVTPAAGNGPADAFWHATDAFQVQNWTDVNLTWAGGGSGISPGPGLILPSDIAYAQVHGDFGHVLAVNAQNSALGTYTGPNGLHPAGTWPATKGIGGTGGDGKTVGAVGIPHGARVFLDPTLTDADLAALGVTKTWMLWLAHTMQRWGCMSKESNTGQGAAGNIMCESIQSIAWNAAHGVSGYSGFQWPWFADGTMTGDHDTTTYNGAFPTVLVPLSNSHWKVFDWNKSYPGITVAA